VRYLAPLLLLLSGCLYQPHDVTPPPAPVSDDAIAQAAEDAVHAFAAGLSANATETADKAATFKNHAEAVDFGAKLNKASREEAFAPLFKLINDELQPQTKPYDAEATAKVFRSVADGAGRVK
jgi:hypothetical protein